MPDRPRSRSARRRASATGRCSASGRRASRAATIRRRSGRRGADRQRPPMAPTVAAHQERPVVAGGVARHLDLGEELTGDQGERDLGCGHDLPVGPQPRAMPGAAAVGRRIDGGPRLPFPSRFGERPTASRAREVGADQVGGVVHGRRDRPPAEPAVGGPEHADRRAHPPSSPRTISPSWIAWRAAIARRVRRSRAVTPGAGGAGEPLGTGRRGTVEGAGLVTVTVVGEPPPPHPARSMSATKSTAPAPIACLRLARLIPSARPLSASRRGSAGSATARTGGGEAGKRHVEAGRAAMPAPMGAVVVIGAGRVGEDAGVGAGRSWRRGRASGRGRRKPAPLAAGAPIGRPCRSTATILG